MHICMVQHAHTPPEGEEPSPLHGNGPGGMPAPAAPCAAPRAASGPPRPAPEPAASAALPGPEAPAPAAAPCLQPPAVPAAGDRAGHRGARVTSSEGLRPAPHTDLPSGHALLSRGRGAPSWRPPRSVENLEEGLAWPGLGGGGSQAWAHLPLSAHEFALQHLVSPQLGLQPTQVLGHITGEACGFLLRTGGGQGLRKGGQGTEPGVGPCQREPLPPHGLTPGLG